MKASTILTYVVALVSSMAYVKGGATIAIIKDESSGDEPPMVQRDKSSSGKGNKTDDNILRGTTKTVSVKHPAVPSYSTFSIVGTFASGSYQHDNWYADAIKVLTSKKDLQKFNDCSVTKISKVEEERDEMDPDVKSSGRILSTVTIDLSCPGGHIVDDDVQEYVGLLNGATFSVLNGPFPGNPLKVHQDMVEKAKEYLYVDGKGRLLPIFSH